MIYDLFCHRLQKKKYNSQDKIINYFVCLRFLTYITEDDKWDNTWITIYICSILGYD